MPSKVYSYNEIRSLMEPGDIIAFGGNSRLQELIKFATRSEVSHVGIVFHTQMVGDTTGRYFNQVIQSTSEYGFSGITISRISEQLESFNGQIWWLPLKKNRRQRMDQASLFEFVLNQAKHRTAYDMPQAISSALEVFDQSPLMQGPEFSREDFARTFGAELFAAAFEVAGVIGSIAASEVNAIELCRWAIFESDYSLLKGDPSKTISRFNSMDPQDFGI